MIELGNGEFLLYFDGKFYFVENVDTKESAE
ncbi:hypothetical protein SPSYN_02008 [Sporotomaculum syntrophicum]|uniref:Uncharacterized protein n=1 Tax=Sporotomaculum syntrophicum TaxID=182264 RepID=A0A9D3AYJ7_9FIRM|nr:hypothetical protein SPSYN_02008 [Sporotomaculum syntrophicum]